MREKKAIEDKMEALRSLAQSCRRIGARTHSFVTQCWKPVDIVVPWDDPVQKWAPFFYEKCIRLEQKEVTLSKEVSSLDKFYESVIANQFCTNDDGTTSIAKRSLGPVYTLGQRYS